MLPTDNKSVATEEGLRFSLRGLAPPLLRRKGTLSVTFLLVVSITLLLGHLRLQKSQPQSTMLAQPALTDAKAAPITIVATQRSQSLNEADLDHEAKLAEQNYLRYLSTREQERAGNSAAYSPIANVTITVRASSPPLPAQSTTVLVMIAIVLGLLISLFLSYLVDYCDPCFHSPVQVIRTLRIPFVVAIPREIP